MAKETQENATILKKQSSSDIKNLNLKKKEYESLAKFSGTCNKKINKFKGDFLF